MRPFLTLALIGLCFSLTAQETINYPYNPDGDVDGTIASPDLLDILGVYGNAFTPTEIQIDGVGLAEVIGQLSDAIVTNSSNIIAISFFSDCNDVYNTGIVASVPIIYDHPFLTPFVPILPASSATYFNLTGYAIGIPNGSFIYGEYMPYKGEIVGAAINLAIHDSAGEMKFNVVNYSTGINELIGVYDGTPFGNTVQVGSLYYNTTGEFGQSGGIYPGPGTGGPGIVSECCQTPVTFFAGEYIGIAVEGPLEGALNVAVSGTLYVRLY